MAHSPRGLLRRSSRLRRSALPTPKARPHTAAAPVELSAPATAAMREADLEPLEFPDLSQCFAKAEDGTFRPVNLVFGDEVDASGEYFVFDSNSR